jgi:transcription antitermination factor NusG
MTLPEAFSAEVMAELARPVAPYDPRDAELAEGAAVRWYVVSIFSRDAEIQLTRRRFGIFVPATEETVIVRGRKVTRHVPLVAGYVFVLLWETDANWLRVAKTAGVDKILGWVSDVEVEKLRWQESCEQMDADSRRRVAISVVRAARKRPGMSRRKRRKSKQRGTTGGST